MGLWFGAVLQTQGISEKFLSLLSRADTEPKLLLLGLGVLKGVGTARTADPRDTPEYLTSHSASEAGHGGGGGMLGVMLFVLPGHCPTWWSPAVLDDEHHCWCSFLPWALGMNSLFCFTC